MKKYCTLFFACILFFGFDVSAEVNPSCLILLDDRDTENIGNTGSFYLITKLQSAIAEKSVPILIRASLWNSFLERRNYMEQYALQKETKANKVFSLYKSIRERINFWSNYYNNISDDFMQNKMLVVQHINEEFYKEEHDVTDPDYQLLLNYLTPFHQDDWIVYKKLGFYLFIPKDYLSACPKHGFKIENLEQVEDCQDIVLNYFESQQVPSFATILPEFFCTTASSYKWNIILSGHGGSFYTETNDDKKISWRGEPLIADLTLQDFKSVLEFFDAGLNTHLLHYSSCYAGGNHIDLAFEKPYHFAIICECLTDSATYCKWTNLLPSSQKKFLTVDDLSYDVVEKSWDLNMQSPYNWGDFLNSISKIDFSLETIDFLPKALTHITYPAIANISLLRRPGASQFYPLISEDTVKIDDQFVLLENRTGGDLLIKGVRVLLLQNDVVNCNLLLRNLEFPRFISIKPGKACHYIKKLTFENPVDLPSVFWQAEFQMYDKVFLIDECTFPFTDLEQDRLSMEKVMIKQQNTFHQHFIRLFFTVGHRSIMMVVKKDDELDKKALVKEVVELSPEAKFEYEKAYDSLKRSLIR